MKDKKKENIFSFAERKMEDAAFTSLVVAYGGGGGERDRH